MNLNFDTYNYKYSSNRNVVYSNRGMVATGNPMASQAGLEVLKQGGNAIDAAIATAATLSVVEPTCNGLGGDAFSIIYYNDKLYGLNSSGVSPELLTAEKIKNLGYNQIPFEGLIPITVPGQVKAWSEMSNKFGNLDFEKLLKPAIDYAENGYIIQPLVGHLWKEEFKRFYKVKDDSIFNEWFKVFSKNNAPLKAGEHFKNKDLAESLKEIAKTKGQSFYSGAIAYEIDDFMKKNGGYLRKKDLENFSSQWVDPISTNYKGFDICEIPPNGHGITVLIALNILKNLDIENLNSVESIHKQIEALKLAFIDVKEYVADKNHMTYSIDYLLSEEYAYKRANLIKDNAILPTISKPQSGGTVYLATADKWGNMVSYIQSNYTQFGSGIVIPNTGISLHNRGCNFSLNEKSDNYIMPNKRPYHTIIPGFLMHNDKAVGPFGVMGAFMQPQGHLQVLLSTIIEGLNPQDALNKPRWQWVGDKTIEFEDSYDKDIINRLNDIGHNTIIKKDSSTFGRGQIIWKNDANIYCGGCDPRTDSNIAIW